MGDGGVACVPSQLVMERFPNSETFCGGNGGNFNSKSLVQSQLQRKPEKKMEVEKEELENGKMGSVKVQKAKVEKAEFVSDKRRKEDIEKGEIVPEKLRKGEVEMGEIVLEKWRKSAVDKEEFGFARGRKGELEKGEFVPEKWRRGEVEKSEFSSGRGRKGELEKGEFVPEKWRKGEAVKEEFGLKKGRKWETERGEFVADNGRKGERERSPKRLSRWENTREKDSRSGSSRVADEDLGSYKHEYSDRKNHSREYTPGSWLKRNGIESESSGHKYHGDFGDYSASKVRRISDDNGRSSYSEKLLSRRSVEKSYRNSSSSSSRYSSRGAHDRHGRSPVSHSERSPLERARHYDHRDRSPAYLERSPHDRTRHYDHRDRSPVYSERSPHDRPRHYDHRDRSPAYSERSPHERPRHYDHRDRSPAYAERSPLDRVRHHDHRDRTPGYSERSPQDRGRTREYRETNRKNGGSEKQHSRYGNKGHEERIGRKDSSGRDSHAHSSTKPSHTNSANGPEKIVDDQPHKEKQSQNPSADCNEPPSQVSGAPEEFPSMEEDMDICDTPPHVPVMTDPNMGKWFYLDHFGVEQGPSKLRDLKKLVEDGFLLSDHLIKHRESDRWVTVENAASPLVPVNLPSVVSDSVTQLVDPPEAPGNLLVDVGDVGQSVNQPTQELSISSSQPTLHPNDRLVAPELLEDLHIDERVGALLKGYTVIPGRELESVGEALHTSFEHAEWEKWGSSEGFTRFRACTGELSRHSREEEPYRGLEGMQKETVETRLLVPSEKEYVFVNGDSSDWFAGRWSCKGGDWKRNDEATQDKSLKRKVVLNEGYPLCQMPKSGYQDPRWQRKDDLYHPSRIKRLDLPPWSFSWPEEKNDVSSDSSKSMLLSRSNQVKPLVARGIKGTTLPVVRINACVVKDSGPLICESRVKVKGNERHSSRSVRSFSVTSDSKHSFTEGISRSKKVHERDLQGLLKCRTSVNIPKDRVCTVAELELPLGDWYYLDCAGHEHGPSSFSELHTLVAKGTIQNHSSVFRKIDNIWVPITTFAMPSEVHAQEEKEAPTADSATTILGQSQISQSVMNTASSSFHNLHPQFIGYTRGKLHELVMKSYKSREFAAAINEVLDPWISAKQPKKELDKHFPFSSSITKSSTIYKSRKSEEDHIRAGKRARLLVDESEDDSEMEDDLLTRQMNDCLFEDLLDDASFGQENCMTPQTETESWGFLNGRILARVFHFLRADMKSLAFSAATCKRWNMAVKFYKGVSRQVDLSSTGPECTDPMFLKVMSCYDKTKVTSVVLMGCTNVSAGALEEVLQSFPCISSIDIRGCNQFSELMHVSKNVKWLRSSCARNTKIVEESHSKIRSLKQITEKSYLTSKAFKGSGSHLEDSGEPRDSFDHDSNLDKKDSASHSFRQSCYKRTKLLDARKSSSVLSRDARMRRWLRRKPETGYKRMEEFLAFSLKDIMKENTFEFFIPKVAEIEDRMRNGYYVGHGLSSVKEDISRMCRDAIKAKNRGDARDMNHIIMLFIRLVTNLEENSKSSNGRDDMVKTLKDSSVAGFSAASKYKKKHNKYISDRRGMNKSNSSSHVNGIVDYGDYASDREIRRRLSKLNKRSLDSESETSDDPGFSEEDVRGDGESTSSDTESDLDIHSEGGTGDLRGDGYFPVDEGLDSMSEEREWGARMTKASLVPPVTRKYEVIDRYVVIADEEEVQRKMRVALPEDYAEKLSAQKSGTEESDMEIPEVKEYKPRKQLGDEVLEQEVYGIDPYTHNLLLDSMPEESDWPLLEKHLFIEEVLLRALNKKVRHFTGTGNTPMVYPLKPVVEEIQKTAEEGGDTRMVKMCQCIIKAMQNRTDDNYVAYRKGLGVVCNKEEGFGEDDFVVEFLGEVYPTWKWFEKQDGIRSLQKNNNDPAPEFYNIYLERPKGDRDGYDLVVVDAMHKANYASRICHSCRPNAEAKVTAVNGQYQIGIYTVRPIGYGEEITFDYNSVTESKEEYEASVCLCGSQVCRGSYLNLTGEGAYQKVLKERHGILDRHQLLLEACEVNSVSQEDYIDLGRAGLGTCLLAGLPEWLISYSARLVRFINFERTKLPEEILKHNMEEKRKFFSDICLEVEKSDAEIQAEGVYNQRLQNLALTLDKVRYVMRCVYGDPKKAPPPLVKLSPEVLVSAIWKGEGSLVEELLQCIAPHMEADLLNDLKSKIHAHDPSGSDDLQGELRKSLLWLRDEIRHLPCTYKCRHDATADLIHIYAYTKFFFKVQEYKAITSPPVYISPLDLGPKYSDKLGSGFQEYCKTYGENYCLGQLIYWHNQANAEPDCSLARARRGCLSLPDFSSFYAKSQKPSRKRVYGPRTFKFMLARMEKQSQRQWPKDRIWSFKSSPRIFGSPMLDAVVNKSPLDREMMHWLKNRPAVFQAMWDR